MARTIQLVSFNLNEANAIEALLTDLSNGNGSPWARHGEHSIVAFDPEIELQHVPVSAQGNTIAAGRLAKFFSGSKAQDFVVFYGCAGTVDPALVGSAFLVTSVNYLSLGTVDWSHGRETVTIKNKWICHTSPSDAEPLDPVVFPLSTGDAFLDLSGASGIPKAHVIATDKLIRITPDPTPPSPSLAIAPHPVYTKDEWSFGQSLAYLTATSSGSPVLIDMESFGIGLIADALGILNRVAVLRITTDDLVTHATSDAAQSDLLLRGRAALARLIFVLLNPGASLP